MSKHIRLLFAMAVALFAFGFAASTAGAAELAIRPSGEITAASQGLVTFSSSLTRISCRITLLGSLHPGPIAKTAGNLIGYIKRVTAGEDAGIRRCNEEIRILILEAGRTVGVNPANVLWHITYEGILGTLPNNMTGILILIREPNFLLTIPTIFGTQNCLFRATNLGALLGVSGTGPYTSGLIRLLPEFIPPTAGTTLNTSLCPSEGGRLIGSFSLAPAQTITRT